MEAETVIRSRTNALLRRVGALVAGKARDAVLLEGDRLVEDALSAGWRPEVVLVAESRESRARELAGRGLPVRLVADGLLDRVSALETSPGVLAIAPRPEPPPLEALVAARAPRVLVVAGLADPGNLGALARSAEAAGFRALVVARGGARPFGAKALRGSMGSLLRLAVHEAGGAEEIADALAAGGYRQVAAATRGGTDWRSFDWSGPLALWVGGETGIDPEVMGGFEPVTIPMQGQVESLNVTVATSLLLFAAGGAS
jgi:TrmH family RNA methyltransferase